MITQKLLATLCFLGIYSAIASEFKMQQFTGEISDPEFSKSGKIAVHPLIENMTSFGIGHDGSLYIVESPRQRNGQILDIRGARQFTNQDFKNKTIEDRVAMMEADPKTGKAYFNRNSERIAKISDTNGDGVFDHRTLFADGMMGKTADGVAFTAIEHDGSVYHTCIPNVWKFTDSNGDGVADKSEVLLTGFGPKLSMFGHDMHGIIMGPDGRLYWSIGDRGYNVKSKEGKTFSEPSRGAIFRSDIDGSNFEVFHNGLRNPQEIAFDEFGNIFTFDNTGDIGDMARAVYAVESGDSGWYMEHQGLHQYRFSLDHSEFDGVSPWIEDDMFKPSSPKQPKWFLPPISNFHSGPSGITHLSGEGIPPNWNNSFLVTNFRASTARSNILRFKFQEQGASFKTIHDQPVISQIVASDINYGYDGKIYIADFGGGWGVNNRGNMQFIEAPEFSSNPSVKLTKQLFAKGFSHVEQPELLLKHPDMRVRQYAQFELVKRNNVEQLKNAVKNGKNTQERLHGLWGLAQIHRKGNTSTSDFIAKFANDKDQFIRQNVCQSLGNFGPSHKNEKVLIKALQDSSPRVQLKACIALGKIAKSAEAKSALWKLVEANNGKEHIIRHVAVKALANQKDVPGSEAQINNTNAELRLVAVLVLRELEHPSLTYFVKDSKQNVKEEAIRAIYDKHIISAMDKVAAESHQVHLYSTPIQRRILFANLWLGKEINALNIIKISANNNIEKHLKEHAFKALLRWQNIPENDPVFSFYRAQSKRSDQIGDLAKNALSEIVKTLDGKSLSLALQLAQKVNLRISPETLLAQVENERVPADIRISAIDTVIKQDSKYLDQLGKAYEIVKNELVKARLLKLQLKNLKDKETFISSILSSNQTLLIRSLIEELSDNPKYQSQLISAWKNIHQFNDDIKLDLFTAVKKIDSKKSNSLLAAYIKNPDKAYEFTYSGGNKIKGKTIFEGQGACLQCHKVKRKGGVQGPALDGIAKRLSSKELMESLIYPNKLIAKGFGTFVVTDKKGNMTSGVLEQETEKFYLIKSANKKVKIAKESVASTQGPSSGMPAIARALKLDEVRDLVAYLENIEGKKIKGGH